MSPEQRAAREVEHLLQRLDPSRQPAPVPVIVDGNGSVRLNTADDLVAIGPHLGPRADAATYRHAAARFLATGHELLLKAGGR